MLFRSFQGLVEMTKHEIESCLRAQCDERPFMTLKGVLPFPLQQPMTEKQEKEKLAKKQKQ